MPLPSLIFLKTCLVVLLGLAGFSASAEPVTRNEVLQIAKSFAECRWNPTEKNILHGPDGSKVNVNTPNRKTSEKDEGLWVAGTEAVGVPYKWGGFDSVASFTAGIKAGKAGGDLYSSFKRLKGDAAVSSHAVGIDCSGFISRCWKLRQKHGTATLGRISRELASAKELRCGDVMNTAGGHVILFARWLDDSKTRALFYEAHPFSKVIASEHDVPGLVASGFKPLRYREIRD